MDGSGLVVPDPTLIGPDGLPLVPIPDDSPIGLDIVEGPSGDDALEIVRKIAELRRMREKCATLVIAPGQTTDTVLIEAGIFNAEAYSGRTLTPGERAKITKAIAKRSRRAKRRCERGF